MIETAPHTGIGRPDALSVVVPSLLTFVAGLGVGLRAAHRRAETEATPIGVDDRAARTGVADGATRRGIDDGVPAKDIGR